MSFLRPPTLGSPPPIDGKAAWRWFVATLLTERTLGAPFDPGTVLPIGDASTVVTVVLHADTRARLDQLAAQTKQKTSRLALYALARFAMHGTTIPPSSVDQAAEAHLSMTTSPQFAEALQYRARIAGVTVADLVRYAITSELPALVRLAELRNATFPLHDVPNPPTVATDSLLRGHRAGALAAGVDMLFAALPLADAAEARARHAAPAHITFFDLKGRPAPSVALTRERRPPVPEPLTDAHRRLALFRGTATLTHARRKQRRKTVRRQALATVRAEQSLAARRAEVALDLDLTDAGNAARFARDHRASLRFCAELDTWLAWDGARWRRLDTDAPLQAAITATVEALGASCGRAARASSAKPAPRRDRLAGEAVTAHARYSATRRGRAALLELIRAEPSLLVPANALDANPWALNVANGTLDLATGTLHPHDREQLHTLLAPVHFDPAARAPRWDQFLREITAGDAQVETFLRRAAGYSLTGSTTEHCLFFLTGAGSNGKSTFTATLLELLGDYAQVAPPDLFTRSGAHARRTRPPAPRLAAGDVSGLAAGVRFVLCQELDESREWNAVAVKSLTSSDRVRARRPRQNWFEFTPTHKLWVCANLLPNTRDGSHGFWRRFRLVPFGAIFGGATRDTSLLDSLRAELSGILAWALRGLEEWRAFQLSTPDVVARATSHYAETRSVLDDAPDLFAAWRRDHIDVDVDPARAVHTPVADLYRAFTQWLQLHCSHEVARAQRLTVRIFTRRLALECSAPVRRNARGTLCLVGLRSRA